MINNKNEKFVTCPLLSQGFFLFINFLSYKRVFIFCWRCQVNTKAVVSVIIFTLETKVIILSHYFDFFVLNYTKNSSITFYICILRYLTMQLTELSEEDKKALVLIMKAAQIPDSIYCESSLSQQSGFKRLAEGALWCIKTDKLKWECFLIDKSPWWVSFSKFCVGKSELSFIILYLNLHLII